MALNDIKNKLNPKDGDNKKKKITIYTSVGLAVAAGATAGIILGVKSCSNNKKSNSTSNTSQPTVAQTQGALFIKDGVVSDADVEGLQLVGANLENVEAVFQDTTEQKHATLASGTVSHSDVIGGHVNHAEIDNAIYADAAATGLKSGELTGTDLVSGLFKGNILGGEITNYQSKTQDPITKRWTIIGAEIRMSQTSNGHIDNIKSAHGTITARPVHTPLITTTPLTGGQTVQNAKVEQAAIQGAEIKGAQVVLHPGDKIVVDEQQKGLSGETVGTLTGGTITGGTITGGQLVDSHVNGQPGQVGDVKGGTVADAKVDSAQIKIDAHQGGLITEHHGSSTVLTVDPKNPNPVVVHGDVSGAQLEGAHLENAQVDHAQQHAEDAIQKALDDAKAALASTHFVTSRRTEGVSGNAGDTKTETDLGIHLGLPTGIQGAMVIKTVNTDGSVVATVTLSKGGKSVTQDITVTGFLTQAQVATNQAQAADATKVDAVLALFRDQTTNLPTASTTDASSIATPNTAVAALATLGATEPALNGVHATYRTVSVDDNTGIILVEVTLTSGSVTKTTQFHVSGFQTAAAKLNAADAQKVHDVLANLGDKHTGATGATRTSTSLGAAGTIVQKALLDIEDAQHPIVPSSATGATVTFKIVSTDMAAGTALIEATVTYGAVTQTKTFTVSGFKTTQEVTVYTYNGVDYDTEALALQAAKGDERHAIVRGTNPTWTVEGDPTIHGTQAAADAARAALVATKIRPVTGTGTAPTDGSAYTAQAAVSTTTVYVYNGKVYPTSAAAQAAWEGDHRAHDGSFSFSYNSGTPITVTIDAAHANIYASVPLSQTALLSHIGWVKTSTDGTAGSPVVHAPEVHLPATPADGTVVYIGTTAYTYHTQAGNPATATAFHASDINTYGAAHAGTAVTVAGHSYTYMSRAQVDPKAYTYDQLLAEASGGQIDIDGHKYLNEKAPEAGVDISFRESAHPDVDYLKSDAYIKAATGNTPYKTKNEMLDKVMAQDGLKMGVIFDAWAHTRAVADEQVDGIILSEKGSRLLLDWYTAAWNRMDHVLGTNHGDDFNLAEWAKIFDGTEELSIGGWTLSDGTNVQQQNVKYTWLWQVFMRDIVRNSVLNRPAGQNTFGSEWDVLFTDLGLKATGTGNEKVAATRAAWPKLLEAFPRLGAAIKRASSNDLRNVLAMFSMITGNSDASSIIAAGGQYKDNITDSMIVQSRYGNGALQWAASNPFSAPTAVNGFDKVALSSFRMYIYYSMKTLEQEVKTKAPIITLATQFTTMWKVCADRSNDPNSGPAAAGKYDFLIENWKQLVNSAGISKTYKLGGTNSGFAQDISMQNPKGNLSIHNFNLGFDLQYLYFLTTKEVPGWTQGGDSSQQIKWTYTPIKKIDDSAHIAAAQANMSNEYYSDGNIYFQGKELEVVAMLPPKIADINLHGGSDWGLYNLPTPPDAPFLLYNKATSKWDAQNAAGQPFLGKYVSPLTGPFYKIDATHWTKDITKADGYVKAFTGWYNTGTTPDVINPAAAITLPDQTYYKKSDTEYVTTIGAGVEGYHAGTGYAAGWYTTAPDATRSTDAPADVPTTLYAGSDDTHFVTVEASSSAHHDAVIESRVDHYQLVYTDESGAKHILVNDQLVPYTATGSGATPALPTATQLLITGFSTYVPAGTWASTDATQRVIQTPTVDIPVAGADETTYAEYHAPTGSYSGFVINGKFYAADATNPHAVDAAGKAYAETLVPAVASGTGTPKWTYDGHDYTSEAEAQAAADKHAATLIQTNHRQRAITASSAQHNPAPRPDEDVSQIYA